MSARRDLETGDFVRDANGKIVRFKKRFGKCRVCGARHDPKVLPKECIEKRRSEPENKPEQQYRGGTLRYTRESGEKVIAEPGSMWFSTFTMLAQEVWSEDAGDWINIEEGFE